MSYVRGDSTAYEEQPVGGQIPHQGRITCRRPTDKALMYLHHGGWVAIFSYFWGDNIVGDSTSWVRQAQILCTSISHLLLCPTRKLIIQLCVLIADMKTRDGTHYSPITTLCGTTAAKVRTFTRCTDVWISYRRKSHVDGFCCFVLFIFTSSLSPLSSSLTRSVCHHELETSIYPSIINLFLTYEISDNLTFLFCSTAGLVCMVC